MLSEEQRRAGQSDTVASRWAKGLEGVVVAETRLSQVDGEHGRLVIAGCDVESLALSLDFEQVGHLLWQQAEMNEAMTSAALGEARERAFLALPSLGNALEQAHVMDALRSALSHLPSTAKALDIVAATSVFTAAWARARMGQAPIAPTRAHGHAHDLLAMLGASTTHAHVRALDAYLVTVSDHGLNASTFAARVVASTGSDPVSAVTAAVGALKGPLHGGAPGPVLDMLDAIGATHDPKHWLQSELDAGRRIMGMGHRIYRVRDPRAYVLEQAIEMLEHALAGSDEGHRSDGKAKARLQQARAVERAAEDVLRARKPGRSLRANVEFYTAVLLEAVGVPRELFSAVFAVGRSAGWLAHFSEQQKTGRLLRPASRYIGALPLAVHVGQEL